MSSAPVNERRNKLRKKPLRLVYVELAFGNGGMMRDLSEEGFAVRVMMPVRQGDKTPFSFTLGESARIEGEGKILWIEEGGRVAGVEFLQISPVMRTRIDDWLIEDEKMDSPREAPALKEPAIPPASTMEELREEIRSIPARAEESPAETEQQASARMEEARTSEIPPPEVKPKIEVPVAKEPLPLAPKEETEAAPPIPAVRPQPDAPLASSATEGPFRKWPKHPLPSAARADDGTEEMAQPAASETLSETPTQELPDEGPERPASMPLPDISEILIQPHGMSAPAAARPPRDLPELPEPVPTGRRSFEWFTLWRAVLSMMLLAAVARAYVYHREIGSSLIWLGETMGGSSAYIANPPAPSPSPRENVPAAAETTPAKPENGDTNAPGPAETGTANARSSLSGASKGTPPPVTPLAGITPPASPEASPDAGQAEFLQAVQILRGRNAGVDTPEAVRLLWIAVEKGNPSAEVTLADLYWHGQGVARNCDQTRILLTAASRKGSAEAQKRLQQFQREGCE